MMQTIARMSPQMLDVLTPENLRDFSPETLAALPASYIAKLDPKLQAELQGILAGTAKPFMPESTIATVDGNPALILVIYKDGQANAVLASHTLYDKMDELKAAYPGLRFDISDLAKVVIGGLLASTLLTLVVVPVVYSLLDRWVTVKQK